MNVVNFLRSTASTVLCHCMASHAGRIGLGAALWLGARKVETLAFACFSEQSHDKVLENRNDRYTRTLRWALLESHNLAAFTIKVASAILVLSPTCKKGA